MANQKEKEKIYEAVGEVVLLAIVITAVFLCEYWFVGTIELGIRLSFCVIVLLSYKQFYAHTFHAPPKPAKWKHNYLCLSITYGLFLFFVLVTWAYKAEWSLILLTVGVVAYGNAKLGDWQITNRFRLWEASIIEKENSVLAVTCADYEKQLVELRNSLKDIQRVRLYEMSEGQLRQYGAAGGLSIIQQDILVLRILSSYTIADIARERGLNRTTVQYHIERILSKLDICKI